MNRSQTAEHGWPHIRIKSGLHSIEAGKVRIDPFTTPPFKLSGTSVNNGVTGGYRVLLVDEMDHAWLTVLPKENSEKKMAEDEE